MLASAVKIMAMEAGDHRILSLRDLSVMGNYLFTL